MKNRCVFVLTAILSVLICACSSSEAEKLPLLQHPDSVQLVLLGISGCGNTERITEELIEFQSALPPGVAVTRVEVPMLNALDDFDVSDQPDDWPYDFCVDTQRRLADHLEFFFYPTFYILDREQRVRFAGDFNADSVKKMLTQMANEKPGDAPQIFTPPLLPLNTVISPLPAPYKKLIDLNNPRKRGYVFLFHSVLCPFSMQALKNMGGQVADFEARGIVPITVMAGKKEIPDTEEDVAIPNPVFDPDFELTKNRFHVPAYPFVYVLDDKARVIFRGPYDSAKLAHALTQIRGITPMRQTPVQAVDCGGGG